MMLDVRILAAVVVLIYLLMAWSHTHAEPRQQTFRDNRGNTVGTVTTDSVGNKTYRDARGNTLGTSTPEKRR